jgi:hypothetical protein
LPLKALAWEDSEGKIWLGYTDPGYFARRFNLSEEQAAPIRASDSSSTRPSGNRSGGPKVDLILGPWRVGSQRFRRILEHYGSSR